MFEGAYTRELIELGYKDAMEARTALLAFIEGGVAAEGDDVARSRAGDLICGRVVGSDSPCHHA